MISGINSFLVFKVNEIEFKLKEDSNEISEISFTLTNSLTSQLIFQSSNFDLSEISNLSPIQFDADLSNSLTLSFYMQALHEKKLIGSALIDLSPNIPLKTWLSIPSNNDEILSVEIEITKEENIENSFEIIQEAPDKSDSNEKRRNLQINNIENRNEQEINELLRLYEIDDINNLAEKIEETKDDIAFYRRKKRIEDEEEAKNKLKGLERLHQLHEEMKTAKENEKNRHNENNFEEGNLEEELKKGLSKCNIENPEKLEEMIADTKENISFCIKRKRLEEAKIEEKLLAELENLNSIYKKISIKSMIILDPKEIENTKQLDHLEGMLGDISSLPICAERFLTSILCYAYYKSYELDPILYIHQKLEQIDPYKEFRNFLEFLNQNTQGIFPRNLITSFKENFENKNWEYLIKDTEKILKEHIRPINVKELSRLISKSAQYSEYLENKDIILLFGITGSGKSTTTHFLCESKLDRVLEDGVRHIKAIAVKDPTLKSIAISSHAQSETRYITLVPIKIKDSEEIIYLCDTPGLMDTNGAEVDMANTISIVECVKKCRSVRPLILLSSKYEGDRFEGVKKLTHTLARLVPDFNKYSNSFTYAFTKYKKKDASNIHGLVSNAIKKIEIPDEAFLHILNDIKHKTTNGAITIDPLKDDPKELIQKILERKPIEDPKNAFHSFITEDSRLSIKQQVSVYSKDIEKALNSMNYEIIKYKLDDLKYLASLFKQFEPQYISCVDSVIKTTNDTYNKTVTQFNSFLDKHGTLDNDNIKAYKEIYDALKASENIRESHLKSDTVTSAAMVVNIVSKLSLAHLNLKSDTIDSYVLKAQLNNAKILSKTFEDVTPHYKGLCKEYINLIENLLSSAEFYMDNNNFEDFANTLLRAKKYLEIALDHLNLNYLEEKYSLLLDKFISSLRQRCEKSIALLNKGYIKKYDIEILKENISMIKSANDTHSLNSLIPNLEIKEFLQSIITVYQQYFEKTNNDVISFINNQATNNIAEIETKFDEFSLLMEIPDIEYLVSASYQESLNSLINKISFFRKEAKEIVKSFINSPDSVDFNHLRNCFFWLESGKWVEKLREGIYSNEISGIEKEIKNYIDKLLFKLKEIDLGISCPFNVSQGYNIIQKLYPILQLKEFIPSLENYNKDIWIIFRERVEETLKLIKREFNPELQDIEKENNDLKRLMSIRNEYPHYGEERKEEILEIYGLESIEEINTEIIKIQNFIEIFSKKLKKNIFDIDKIENSYNYIMECRAIPEFSEIIEPFSSNIYSLLSQFYNNHLISLKKCFDAIFNQISNRRNWDINIIKKNSHQFSLSFKEILLLNAKSQSFFKSLEYQPHFDYYTNELNNLSAIFNEKLRICDEKNELKTLSLLLAIANDFAKVNDNFAEISVNYGKIQNLKQDQTCQSIIESIESHNFEKSNQLIAMLDETVYRQSIDIIKEKFYCQIESLLKDLTDSCSNITNSKLDHSQVNAICSNFQKIAPLKIYNFYSLLDGEVARLFIDQEREIKNIFMDKIIEFIYSIENAINSHKYYEAEVKMKNAQELKSNIIKIFGLQFWDKHAYKTQKKLEEVPRAILHNMRSSKIKDYKDYHPRLILQEFEDASKDFPKYKDSPNQIKNIIYEKFDAIKRAIPEKSPKEKKLIITDISSVLEFLPNDFKNLAIILIDDIKKDYKEQKKYTREKICILAKERNIKELCAMHRKPINQLSVWESYDIETKLREILLTYKDEINLGIYQREWEKTFQNAWVLEFKDKIKDIINDSDWILSNIEQSLKKTIEFALNSLLNIDHKDESSELVEAFKFYTIFMNFKIKFEIEKGVSNIFNISNNIETMLVGISEFYLNLNKSYLEYRPPNNVHNCNKILNKIKEWDELFRIFKEYLSQYENYHVYMDYKKIKNIPRYSELVDDLSEILRQLNNYFINIKIQNDEIKHQKLLEDRANEIQDRFNQIKNFEDIKNHINPQIANFEKIESGAIDSISREMDRIVEDASHLINKEEIREEEFNEIRIYYNCLVMFEKNLKIKGFDWKKTLRGIEAKIYSKTTELREKAEAGTQVGEIVEPMIKMKSISINFPLLKESLDKIMDAFLETFRKKNKALAVAISEELEKHPSGLGIYIVTEHKFFEGVMQRMWVKKTQEHKLDYALDHIKGTNLNKNELEDKYNEYYEHFGELHRIYWRITSNEGVDSAISQILSQTEIESKNHAITSLNPDINLIKDFIPELLAHIAMLWVLLNIKKYNQDVNDEDQEINMVTPHTIQVLSIFRMIGIGYEENTKSKNNLVQILTGEGKSITLAFLCSMLALLGFSVNCACYSEHLSNRDFQDFQPLYTALNVCSYIKYGTFNKLCEDEINSKGDIRTIVLDFIKFGRCPGVYDGAEERPKILLIDEVDVFFTKTFYGNIYRPLAKLKHDTINKLTDYVWKIRKAPQLMDIWNAPEYKLCSLQFPGFEFLIEEAVKDMINHVRQFESHDYIVQRDKICYKENDGVSFNIVYGYNTLFAYYYENEKGNISQESLEENIFIGIKCGMFSFAEIPHKFNYIMGVTGTLETLGDYEKNIIENEYNIKLNTYMPSVFGESNRIFRKNLDIYVENKDNYNMKIMSEINSQMTGKKAGCKRAVLVFFEEETKLMDFYNNSNLKNTDYEIQLMTESLSAEDRGMMIKKATVPNTVSLLTRAYGRGIDFKCQNHEIETNGGVHAIQVFFSENISEETQIMGRSARQGQEGSFSMVLLDSELEKFLASKNDIENMKNNGTIYNGLNEKRNKYNQIKNSNESGHVKQSKALHDSSVEFQSFLQNDDMPRAKGFLHELNKGLSIDIGNSKTIVLMDATGSMSHLLQNAKNTVKVMFSRVCAVLSKKGVSSECFQLQYCVYRNYSSNEDKILQVSPWTNKPDILESFMENVKSEGGQGNEAIEVGLWHINKISQNDRISQVILIGDKPPNTIENIASKRGARSSYWNSSKFSSVEYYERELAKIIVKKIPINAFYVNNSAQVKFEEISRLTKGQSGFLDINSSSGADRLTDLVSQEVLRKSAGEDAVKLYQEMYPRSYT